MVGVISLGFRFVATDLPKVRLAGGWKLFGSLSATHLREGKRRFKSQTALQQYPFMASSSGEDLVQISTVEPYMAVYWQTVIFLNK